MINTAAISRLLTPTLKTVFGDYETYPDQWKEIFKTYTSDRAYEFDLEMRYLGPADIKFEGQPVSVDTMGERIVTNYIHKCVATSFNITKEALEDNQYKKDFPDAIKSMRDSLRVSKDIFGSNILNNAFNAAAPIGDGEPLCSLNHPIDSGVVANRPAVPVAFSEAGIEGAIVQIQSFQMQSGMLAQTIAKKIIVPKQQQFNAARILQSVYQNNTANNAINALYHLNYIEEGYKVNQYLPSATRWFVLTNSDSGLKHFQRTNVESFIYADPETFNMKFTAMERYSFGASNFRSIWGSPGP